MAPLNRFNRDYQPLTPDYNAEFAEAHIRSSLAGAPHDGRIADPDATFGRFISWCLSWWFPTSQAVDATIRVGVPSHSALIGLMLRHAIEFTLIFALCRGIDAYSRSLLYGIAAWCVVNFLLLGTLMSFARQDPTLFFYRMAQLWGIFAVLTLLPLLHSYGAFEMGLIAFIAAGFMWVVMFQGIVSFPEAAEKSLRVAVATALVVGLSELHVSTRAGASLPQTLLLAANYCLLLPFVLGMQHWFAAHRYASLQDVRRYGRSAEPVGRHVGLIFSTLWAHLAAGIAAWLCVATLGHALGALLDHHTPALEQYRPVMTCFGTITAISVGNWLATELLYHGRLPSPSSFFGSYYTMWRCLAAWLSYSAPLNHPAAFDFARPWGNVSMRAAIVALSLTINSAFTVTLLWDWTTHYLNEASTESETEPDSSTKQATRTTFERIANGKYLADVLAGALLLPGAILFLTLHAAWGPSLEAYSEHFERFRDGVTPPLLIFQFRALEAGR